MICPQQSANAPDHRVLFGLITLFAALAGFGTPAPIFAQGVSPVIKINEEAAKADVTTQSLRANISVLMGSGGNITVLTGADGKLMVDGGLAVSRPKIQAALDGLGAAPVKYLINTHWHWDHTDGNEWLKAQGATIIAQENTLKRLSATTRVEDWDYTFNPWPVSARPTVTFKTDKTLRFDGETIIMKNYGRGHTDTDIWVYFKNADVMATGDIFWNGVYPFIDNSTGGGIDEMIRWANETLKRVTDKTIIVPGHGPVGTRAQFVEFRDMLIAVRERVARLKKQGKSIDETVAAKPTADFDPKWGNFVISPALFTRLVYAGV
ncbi:MAG: MBL fold metallo-hydrolase [Acidobacteria bacterium]|nr:MBL fold metallo-hydrolase [Acidobacteriota bacterium]